MVNITGRKLIIYISIFLLSLGLGILYKLRSGLSESILPAKINQQKAQILSLAGNQVTVEVADTPEKKELGLSGRQNLAKDTAMIFPYDPPEKVVFWMPDMNFPIDIVYVANHQVVEIYDQVPNFPDDTPREDLPHYPSRFAVDLVIELPAGWSKEHSLKVGDNVQ